MHKAPFSIILAALGCAACAQLSSSNGGLAGVAATSANHPVRNVNPPARRTTQSPIQHVVIIVQENRSVDNLFQFLPGANTQSYGLDSKGETVQLQAEDLAAPYDMAHVHTAWLTEYANGAMNGFDLNTCKGKCPNDPAYAYVPQSQVAPYYTLAETYAFADDFFETDQGPSFPSHQYLISGTPP